MSCCVPGCTNASEEWTSGFPRDKELLARWKSAIQAGTGQVLPIGSVLKDDKVCNMHFVVLSGDATNKYFEPSLFFRNNVLLEVSCCRLCFRYEIKDSMLNMEDCLEQGDAMQWMAKKYSGSTQLGTEDVFFCEKCILRVSKSEEFEQEIRDAARKHGQLFQKMAQEELMVTRVSSIRIKQQENNGSQSISSDCPAKENIFNDIIIKREPQSEEMSESDVSENLEDFIQTTNDIEVKNEPIEETTNSVSIDNLQNPVEIPVDIVVKEEPQLIEADYQTSKTVWHKCKSCDASYPMQHELVRHIRAVHPHTARIRKNQNQWVCHTQSWGHKRVKGADRRKPLASRMGGESRKETVCLLCQQLFSISMDAVTHFKEVHADTDLTYYPCPLCDEVFFSSSSIRNHFVTHDAIFNCDVCGKTLKSNDALVNHRHIFHSEPLAEDKYVKCPKCDQKYKRYNFRKHGRICKGKVKEFSCAQCNKGFLERRALREHRKIHYDEKPLKCSKCGRRYNKPGSLVSHEEICTGDIEGKPLVCAGCGKGYRLPGSLVAHEKICRESMSQDGTVLDVPKKKPIKRKKQNCETEDNSFEIKPDEQRTDSAKVILDAE